MNIKPEQIPDEVVEAACAALAVAMEFGDTWPDDYTDEQRCELRRGVRTSLAAALPVMFEAVGWIDSDGRFDWHKYSADAREVYALTPPRTPPMSSDSTRCTREMRRIIREQMRRCRDPLFPAKAIPKKDTPNADQ